MSAQQFYSTAATHHPNFTSTFVNFLAQTEISTWREKLPNSIITLLMVCFILLLPRYTESAKVFLYLLYLLGLIYLGFNLRDLGRLGNPEKAFFAIIVLTFLWVLIGYYANGEPGRGAKMIWNRHVHYLLLIPLFFLFRQFRIHWNYLVLGLVLSAFVALIDIVDIYSAGENYRFKGMNPNAFGPIQLVICGVLMLSFIFSSGKRVKALSLLGSIIALITVVLSQSRGTWVVIPFIFAFYVFYLGVSWSLSRKLLVSALCVTLLSGAYFIPMVKKRVDFGITNVQAYLAIDNHGSAEIRTSSGIRFELWRTAIKIFMVRPVTGIGIGGFQPVANDMVSAGEANKAVAPYQHPHNQYLNILATRGMVGLVLFLGLLAVPVYIAMSDNNDHRRSKIVNVSIVLLSLTYGVSSFFADHFEQKPTIIFYVAMMAYLLAERDSKSWH